METAVAYSRVPGVKIRKFTIGVAQRVVRIVAGIGTGVRYGVHNNSLNNLVRGVAERVLYKPTARGLARPPGPVDGVFRRRLATVRSRLLRQLSPTPIVALEEYPKLYTGRKQLVYERAVTNLLARGFIRDDADVSAFVKAEKINFTAKPDPAPRVIQPRAPEYNAMVGRYLKPFEKELFRGFRRAFGYPVVLKGMNADGVALELRKSWDCFERPAAVGLDASRFDQHVSVPALQYEHSVYNSVFRSPELAGYLRLQLRNRVTGRAADGIVRYQVDGCRMSGDINTGMGNCLIMSSIVLAYFDHVGLNARLANNGDDCVVVCDQRDLHKLDGIDAWFTDFGFVLTREAPAYVFERIEFCQCQPVLCSTGWRMVRNPHTAMSKDSVSLLGWSNESEFDAWASAIGQCGLSLTSGVPVWEAFYRRLAAGRDRREWAEERVGDSGMGYMAKGVVAAVITPETRYSFWLAFGLLPDEQEALEEDMPSVHYSEPRPMTFAEVDSIQTATALCLANAKTRL